MWILNPNAGGEGDRAESQRDSLNDCVLSLRISQGLQMASPPPDALQGARLHLYVGGAYFERMGCGSPISEKLSRLLRTRGNQIASLRNLLTLVGSGDQNY